MVANFKNREDAGRKLAEAILAVHPEYSKNSEVIVLGLARGGVPVAAQVASVLGVDLDVLVVRKLGMPLHEEYAFGAIAPNHTQFVNEDLVARAGLSQSQIQRIIDAQQKVLAERDDKYRGGRGPVELTNRIAIIVDDGIATGATMKAAVMFARKASASRLVVAVPVSPTDSRAEFRAIADEFICPNEEILFSAVGQFYEEFGQVDDAEVIELLCN